MEQNGRGDQGQAQAYVLPQTGNSNGYKHSRVTSTVAQSFAADLDSMFGLGMSTSSGLDTLSQTVEEKKEKVTSGQSELERLEAQLRETKERLAKVSRQNSPSRPANLGAISENTPPTSSTTTNTTEKSSHPLAERPLYPADRPPTGGARPQVDRENTHQLMQGMPGALPDTPAERVNGKDDYVMVEGDSGR